MAPEVTLKSFADVGLWPWNPDRIRELCQKHCPPPSQPSGGMIERQLERITKKITAEQIAERNRIIALGELMTMDTSGKEPRYHLREKKKLCALK